jgi:uncharacterized membrane protein YjjB (DUF3815 family)
MIIQVVAAFFGTIAFSLLFNVPSKHYLYCGLTGAVGWLCYLWSHTILSATISSFIATLAVAMLSRIFAVKRKTPITVFLIPGIFPLVPGAGIYYASYYIVINDLVNAAVKGIETIKIASSIVVGVTVILSLPRKYVDIKPKFRKVKNNNGTRFTREIS